MKTSLGKLREQGFATIQTGPFGTVLKAAEYSDVGVPVVSVGEIRCGYIEVLERTPRVPEDVQRRLPQFLLEEGDIVFGRKGGIDRNALIGLKESGWFLGSDGIRLRLSGAVDSMFVSYQFRSPAIGKWLLSNSSGSIMPSLNEGVLGRLPLWLPEFDEQKKIAAVLSGLDAKIDLNHRINAELEALAKTIYDYWFVQFDFPDAHGRPYKSSGGAMVWNDTLKREIPAGWEAGSLDDLGQIVGGSTPSTANPEHFGKGMIPWITPKDLSNNKSNKFIARGETDVSEAGKRSASLTLYPAGTVLMSSRAPVGYLAIALNPVTTNQGFKSFVPTKGYGTSFVYYAVKRSLPTIIQYASGSTFVEISGGVLKSVHAVLPDKSVTNTFCKQIEPIVKRQQQAEVENIELTQVRDWLLPLLMNGQVRVA
ncbi:restriction endonuclease subunit S [Rhodanobacter sp. TND4FH1]